MERTVIIKKSSFRSFLTGALIGAGVALLFAPHTGRETREMITDKSLDLKDRATDVVNDTRERAQMTFATARNKVEETVKNVKDRAQEDPDIRDLKRELEIMDDVNNPSFPL
jgi:gas vesicle protein